MQLTDSSGNIYGVGGLEITGIDGKPKVPSILTTWGTITGTLALQTDLQNALNGKFNNPTGTISQYIRGDGTLANFPSLGLTVGSTTIATGVVGRILFQGTGNVLQQSGNLFWDNTNARLGVNTATPSAAIEAIGSNFKFGRAATVDFDIQNTGASLFLRLSAGTTDVTLQNLGSYDIGFNNNFSRVMTLKPTGNVLIGTTTDAGFKLDVVGNSRFSLQAYFTSSVNTNLVASLQNANLTLTSPWADSTQVLIETITNKAQVLIVRPTANITLASTTHDTQRITHTFAPTSGTAVVNALTINQTINQTGGANGITRGLYINPTLTAAADFRAIETTAGNVHFGGTGNIYIDQATNKYIYGYGGTYIKFYDTLTGGLDIYNVSGTGTTRIFGGLSVSGSLSVGGSFSMNGNLNIGNGNYLSADNSSYNRIYPYNGSNASMRFIVGHPTVGHFEWEYPINTTIMTLKRSGNLLVGTTTDAGYKLDVNGTARVSGVLSMSSATGGYAYLQDTSALAAINVIAIQNVGGNYAILSRSSTGGYVADHYGIVVGSASNSYQRWFTSGSERMRLADTGNLLINTTTDAGYKLDVNGTARVVNSVTALSYLGNADVQFGLVPSSGANTYIRLENTGLVANGILFNTNNSSNNFRFKHATNYTFTLGYQNTSAAWFGSNTSLVTVNASAQVQIDSTTKGFLPPRMTTAEKTAIATPAAGLVVYDTTLNKLCLYNGAAWETITSL